MSNSRKHIVGLNGWRLGLHRRFIMREAAPLVARFVEEAGNWTAADSARVLTETLSAAAGEVPHYQRIAAALPSGGVELDEYPLLRREDIRDRYDDLLSPRRKRSRCYESATGGSTGRPVTVLHDALFALWVRATEHHYFRETLGIEPDGVPKVVFWATAKFMWGARLSWKKRASLFLTRTKVLSATVMSRQDLIAGIEAINRRKPKLIVAYASCLYRVAQHVKRDNARVHRPEFIVTTAETLHPEMRATIEDAFGVPVYDFYGTREVGPVAGQCREGRMHVFPWMTHVEVLGGDNSPVGAGGAGRLVVTSVRNACMPIIRYDIGDMAVSGGACGCGSRWPALGAVGGRQLDYFRLRDGTLLYGGYFVRMLQSRWWVDEFRAVQKAENEVEVLYVPRGPVPAEEVAEMEAKVRLAMGPDAVLRLTPVESIPVTGDGKRVYTVGLAGVS